MLNGDGNENSKKSVGLKLAKKKQLYTCSTLLQLHVILPFFFVFFFFCTTTTSNFLVTHLM